MKRMCLSGMMMWTLMGGLAMAQPLHGDGVHQVVSSNPNPPVQAYGNFTRMQHGKDFSAKVVLREAVEGAGWYGVGALSELTGEVTILDGVVYISHGRSMDGRISAQGAGDEAAALLATSRVSEWHAVTIPQDMDEEALHAFILEQAAALGLDLEVAFPFLLRGTLLDYQWHVNAEPHPRFQGHGKGFPMAIRYEDSGAWMEAELVGFYSGAALEGIISHPGERFHVHLLDPARTINGHLDAYGIGEGAELLLPWVGL